MPDDPPASAFAVAHADVVRPRAGRRDCRITWIGHSTCLLQVGGLNVLTDPVWSERASPVPWAGPRRVVAPPLALEALPPLDLVLLSHDHYDHFDTPTVGALVAAHPAAQWAVPLRLAEVLRELGAGAVAEFDWWERRTLATPGGPAVVTAVPAQHFSGRTPFDRDATLWCGFACEAGGRRVLFAGDTGLHPEFERIGEACGPFDAALVPIGAYEPRWFMRPVHMDPDEAVRAYVDLTRCDGACAFVPIHWGTFKLTDEALDEPPARLAAAWRRQGLLDAQLRVLRHGETVRL
jgi:N-acyl-phosphatidylethanolamine-hydrolysing phospholipase D